MAKKAPKPHITFYVLRDAEARLKDIVYPAVLLIRDNWDDYGFKTLFNAELRISPDKVVKLGDIKIAIGQSAFRPDIPAQFHELPKDGYSLGQSIAYYRRLKQDVPTRIRKPYLKCIRDCVAHPSLQKLWRDTPVWQSSFMRSASAQHSLDRGGFYIGSKYKKAPTPRFEFRMHVDGARSPHIVCIDFTKKADLPNRINLFIGKNGTGKTTALATLAYKMSPGDETFDPSSLSGIAKNSIIEKPPRIANIIAVSYNAFDEFPLPKPAQDIFSSSYKSRLSYKYCGLRNLQGSFDTQEISRMLGNALKAALSNDREEVLIKTLSKLIGKENANAICSKKSVRPGAYKALSAGQRLITAIISDIIGFIEEGSLLLIDEPETHLHPGLLTSVIVAIQDVLEEFDSYAIISTHSPILLQQVPSHFVRVFSRSGEFPEIQPLERESFGEDLGELTRTVFGLAEPERDYTYFLRRLFKKLKSAEKVDRLFGGRLGLPAKAYLYSLEKSKT